MASDAGLLPVHCAPSPRSGHRLWPWMAALLLANFLDVCLTRYLIGGGVAYEANPVGAWILEKQGWIGLCLLKGIAVALVLGIGLVLCRNHRLAARRLLQFLTGFMTTVVVYSLFLAADGSQTAQTMDREKQRAEMLKDKTQNFRQYLKKMNELAQGLINGNLSLDQATRELRDYCVQVQHFPIFPEDLERSRGLDPRLLAAHLLRKTSALLRKNPCADANLLARLEAEFSQRFPQAMSPAGSRKG